VPPRPRALRSALLVPVSVVAVVLARLAVLGAPISRDEAGFLLVGGQWGPGRSLYGDYFTDRPPGLVALYAVADALGGLTALRLLGMVVAAGCVLLAALLARQVAPGRPAAAAGAAVVTAGLLSTPLTDFMVVNGELLALPFVLGGTWALLRAVPALTGVAPPGDRESPDGRPPPVVLARWALLAGVLGAGALSVKQSFGEVAALAVLLAAYLLWRAGLRPALVLTGTVLAGALMLMGALLALSAWRGTDVTGLWEAVVGFRGRAGEVIAEYAPPGLERRGLRLLGAFVATGAPLGLLLVLRLPWRPRGGLGRDPVTTWLCAALMVVEGVTIGLGGSYWLHYLVQLVPGTALLVACALGREPTRPRWRSAPVLGAITVGVVAVASVVGFVDELVDPRAVPPDEVAVIDYLRDHASPDPADRTAVIAFGNPALLWQTDMTSPYPELWSLPARVRDPRLDRLTALLESPQAPTWVVTGGGSLDTWGIDARTGDCVLAQRYERVLQNPTYGVWRRR